MNPDFWHQRWKNNEIGFHLSEANPLLVNYFNTMSLDKGSRLFIPLCGKTHDIAWLLSQGYCVAGAELSEIAVTQLFADLGFVPNMLIQGSITHYSADRLDIFVGDIFELTAAALGKVDAVYDRAALVAMPQKMRVQYTSHLLLLTNHAPQLLISYEYDQQLMNGPPFSISHKEVKEHYTHVFELILLIEQDVPGGLKGMYEAKESVWLLKPI